jgi:Flp pilus assembly protein TadD
MTRRNIFCACALGLAFTHTPVRAAADAQSVQMQRYVAARLAEMNSRGGDALKGYAELFKTNAGSSSLTDRLFNNAIRNGDMASAVAAVRTQELRNQADGTAPMLLYADAIRKKNWAAASIAIAELQSKSNYGFAAPILTSWLNVAQNKPHDLKSIDANADQILNYYATDQRIYLDLASGNLKNVKELLPSFASYDTDFARDLAIRAAPILSAQGEAALASSVLGNFTERSYLPALTKATQTKAAATLRAEEGIAALYTRLAGALLEQRAPDQAITLARIAHWLDPESGSAKLILARALQNGGSNEDSYALLRSIPEASPYWPRAVADEARMLSASGSLKEAYERADAAQQRHPLSANLIILSAQMHENAGNSNLASDRYAKLISGPQALNISPRQKAMYLLFLATAQDKSNQWDVARKNLEQARTLDPDNAYILNYLGYALLERNEEIDTAFGYVKRAYQLAPQSAAIADSLGWGYYLGAQYDLALPLLEKAAKQSGNDRAIHEHLGDTYWQLNRRIDARYAWKIAAQQAENNDLERLVRKIDVGIPKPFRTNR